MKKSLCAILVILIIQTACTLMNSTNQPKKQTLLEPTNTIISTDTPAPTATPEPTSTPEPTNTPLPTETTTPTVEPPSFLSNYLVNPVIERVITGDDLFSDYSVNSAYVSIQDDGSVQMVGDGYQGGFEKTHHEEGTGYIYTISVVPAEGKKSFEFETFFDNGNWMTDSYKRFGVYIVNGKPQSDIWVGKQGTGNNLLGNLLLKQGTPYKVGVFIGQNGSFLAVFWNPEKPEQFDRFRQDMGKKWASTVWKFVVDGASGTMKINDLMFVKFDSLKK
jgi:hypothetical protein